MAYRTVKVEKGEGGWGGPLYITPTEKRNKIACITGGGIHPVAQRIAELTGAEAVDAFKTSVPAEEMACVVIDCGGTARVGVYPKMGVLTVDVTPTFPSGPLMAFINEKNFVSGVKPKNVILVEGSEEVAHEKIETAPSREAQVIAPSVPQEVPRRSFIERIGRGMGGIVAIFYQAGRETVDQVIRNIIPFMAFVSTIIGIILYSGIGNVIAKIIAPLAGTLPGLLLISLVCALPVLSPLLGPGAVIAQVVGVLVGVEIGRGNVPPQFALPALFAINPQVGCDFIPVGLTLGEAKPETIEIGVPAVLFSRQITGPIAVIIAYLFSFGLY
ncbi:PTS system, glucitol/sorbitol-specific IIC component [Thermanaeromonas toyohensis ToBE]|uniref:PTS system, glucitol/sorbitol-specific IIC component n=1 Tax=Thermanaeromonas toyohensis ToBE TaxID=698762 RepID=A0A1W1VP53_9FIRM|nr:PTS glucitol/sorbitol transporter subunit IIB [Thermanaeromonas toyohensis]SMB95053.1 PTS system, glucitol/sorbitol-specific IIC component [Thermanaeromonas toyohensis ToBE]